MKKTLLTLLTICSVQAAFAQGVQVSEVYARPTVSGMKQGGAFLTLKNTDANDNALLSARVSKRIAARTELHTHINDNGVMRMREVKQIPLPAGQTVHLKSGGYHIMFLDLKRELKAGNVIPITLTFQNGRTKRVKAIVKALPAPAAVHNHQHDHQHDHHH